MKERIAALLGAGLSASLVSSAVGCSPSYISDLLANDREFALSVDLLKAKDLENMKARDNKWNDLEDTLLSRLGDLVPFMLKPREVLHALQVVNGAKRRSQELADKSNAGASIQINNTVVLALPQRTINQFELSKNNEVISIEGRSLVPMPTKKLLEQVRNEQTNSSTASEENKDERISNSTVRQFERPSIPQEIAERIISAERV